MKTRKSYYKKIEPPPVPKRSERKTIGPESLFLLLSIIIVSALLFSKFSNPTAGSQAQVTLQEQDTPIPTPARFSQPSIPAITTPSPTPRPTPISFSTPAPIAKTGSRVSYRIGSDGTLNVTRDGNGLPSLDFSDSGDGTITTGIVAYLPPGSTEDFNSTYAGPLAFTKVSDGTYYASFSSSPGSVSNGGTFLTPSVILYPVQNADQPSDNDLASLDLSFESPSDSPLAPVIAQFQAANLPDDAKAEFEKALADAEAKQESQEEIAATAKTELETLENEQALLAAQKGGKCSSEGVTGSVDYVKNQFILKIPLKTHMTNVLVTHDGMIDAIAPVNVSPASPSPADTEVTVIYDFSNSNLVNQQYLVGSVTLGYSASDICVIPVKIEVAQPTPVPTVGPSNPPGGPVTPPGNQPGGFSMIWPTKKGSVITLFGAYSPFTVGGRHLGIDIADPVGTPLYAVADGVVSYYITSGGCGLSKVVYIDHGTFNGVAMRTAYQHMLTVSVNVGDHVKQGQQFGTTGGQPGIGDICTLSTHLHFEVRQNNVQVDPMRFLSGSPH